MSVLQTAKVLWPLLCLPLGYRRQLWRQIWGEIHWQQFGPHNPHIHLVWQIPPLSSPWSTWTLPLKYGQVTPTVSVINFSGFSLTSYSGAVRTSSGFQAIAGKKRKLRKTLSLNVCARCCNHLSHFCAKLKRFPSWTATVIMHSSFATAKDFRYFPVQIFGKIVENSVKYGNIIMKQKQNPGEILPRKNFLLKH